MTNEIAEITERHLALVETWRQTGKIGNTRFPTLKQSYAAAAHIASGHASLSNPTRSVTPLAYPEVSNENKRNEHGKGHTS